MKGAQLVDGKITFYRFRSTINQNIQLHAQLYTHNSFRNMLAVCISILMIAIMIKLNCDKAYTKKYFVDLSDSFQKRKKSPPCMTLQAVLQADAFLQIKVSRTMV